MTDSTIAYTESPGTGVDTGRPEDEENDPGATTLDSILPEGKLIVVR